MCRPKVILLTVTGIYGWLIVGFQLTYLNHKHQHHRFWKEYCILYQDITQDPYQFHGNVTSFRKRRLCCSVRLHPLLAQQLLGKCETVRWFERECTSLGSLLDCTHFCWMLNSIPGIAFNPILYYFLLFRPPRLPLHAQPALLSWLSSIPISMYTHVHTELLPVSTIIDKFTVVHHLLQTN